MGFPQPTPGPATRAADVTPNDDNDLPVITNGLWVGGAGDVTVIPANNSDSEPVLFAAVAAGTLLPLSVRRVMDTGTDATLIKAFW